MKFISLRIFVLAFLIFPSDLVLAQDEVAQFDEYIIVKASKLSIRMEPDVNSKKIGSAAKGEWVRVIDQRMADRNLDTVDGLLDTWALIEYEGIKGYMFGAYLDRNSIIKVPNTNWGESYLLLNEDRQLRELCYSKDLQWYGIYEKEDGEYIEKVTVHIEYDSNLEHAELQLNNHLIVKTDKKQKSRLLIGTNENIRLGRVGVNVPSFYQKRMYNDFHLAIPFYEEACSLKNDWYIYGGNLKNGNSNCFIEDYRVSLRRDNPSKIDEICKFDGLIEKHYECNIPFFYWYGDINNDNIPDMVFYSPTKYSVIYKLYLSTQINGKLEYSRPIRYTPIFKPC